MYREGSAAEASPQEITEREKAICHLFDFLERAFGEQIQDPQSIVERLEDPEFTYDDFIDYLKRLNGLVRDIPIGDRSLSQREIHVIAQAPHGIVTDLVSLDPQAQQRLLKRIFNLIRSDGIKDSPQRAKIVGRTLYNGIERIHPFEDGNGRAARSLLFLLSHPKFDDKASFRQAAIRAITTKPQEEGRLTEYYCKLVIPLLVKELEQRGIDATLNAGGIPSAALLFPGREKFGFDPNRLGFLAVWDLMDGQQRDQFVEYINGTMGPVYRFENLPAEITGKYSEKIQRVREEFVASIINLSASEEWPEELGRQLDETYFSEDR